MNRIYCGGLILAGCQHPSSRGQKENKMDKSMGWDKDGLIQKAKDMWKGRKKEEIYSSFHASRQIDVQWIFGSRELVHMAIPAEGKHHNPEYPFYDWVWCIVWNIFWVSSDQVSQLSPLQTSCLSRACCFWLERWPWCCVSSAQQ